MSSRLYSLFEIVLNASVQVIRDAMVACAMAVGQGLCRHESCEWFDVVLIVQSRYKIQK